MVEQKTMNLGFPAAASDIKVTPDREIHNGLDFLKNSNPKLFEQIM